MSFSKTTWGSLGLGLPLKGGRPARPVLESGKTSLETGQDRQRNSQLSNAVEADATHHASELPCGPCAGPSASIHLSQATYPTRDAKTRPSTCQRPSQRVRSLATSRGPGFGDRRSRQRAPMAAQRSGI